MDPPEPRPGRAAALHRVPSRLEDDGYPCDAGGNAHPRARDRPACRPQLRLHGQRARQRRRLDLWPVVRQAPDRARLVSHRRVPRPAGRHLRILRHADRGPLRQIRAAFRPAAHSGAARAARLEKATPGFGAGRCSLLVPQASRKSLACSEALVTFCSVTSAPSPTSMTVLPLTSVACACTQAKSCAPAMPLRSRRSPPDVKSAITVLLPGPASMVSWPPPPMMTSSPSPPRSTSSPALPMMTSLPLPPSSTTPIAPAASC